MATPIQTLSLLDAFDHTAEGYLTFILRNASYHSFPLSTITREFMDERYANIVGELDEKSPDINITLINSLYTPNGDFNSARSALIRNLHTVGILGIKPGPTSSIDWATQFRSSLAARRGTTLGNHRCASDVPSRSWNT